MINKPDVVIYHDDCADGFGAAWAAWMCWGDTVEYVPYSYGNSPPSWRNVNILILDFSFSREDLEKLKNNNNKVQIIDHHLSAQQDLQLLAGLGEEDESLQAHFDMKHSGAVLAWMLIHPRKKVPKMLRLIEDRDLWKFDLEETRAFGYWLRTCPMDFREWSVINNELNSRPEAIMAEAKAVERYVDARIQEALRTVHMRFVDGIEVPSVNVPPFLASDVCNAMLLQNRDAPFVMAYYDHAKGRSYSLRSTSLRYDVSRIAKKYGGGGHRHAAGFGGPR